MKLVALKLQKYVSIWWTNLCAKRVKNQKDKIRTWKKMKAKLKAQFLPSSYVQDNYAQLHNLTQWSMSVDKYAREFEKLQIKCDKHEPEEQTIVRYLVDSNLSMLAWWSSSNLPFLMKYMFLHIRWTNKREGTFSGMSVPNPPKHSPYPLNKPSTRGVQTTHL